MAATVQVVQHKATTQHAATHNSVAYTVAATEQHEPTVWHAATHNTVAFTVAATVQVVQHEATVWITLWHKQRQQLYNMKQLYGMRRHMTLWHKSGSNCTSSTTQSNYAACSNT